MATRPTRSPDILLISRCPPWPLHQGDRLIPYNLARQLSRRGYHIDLLAFYQQPQDQADVPYYEAYFENVTLVEEPVRPPLSLLARAFSDRRRFPLRKSQSWSPQMWDVIEERLHVKRGYDVVHLFGGVHVYEFRELLRRYPTIIAPYESYSLYLERALARMSGTGQRLVTRLQLMMARRYESWMFDGYRRTVVVSDKDAEVLRQLSPNLPVEVIPNGVDLEHWVPTGHEPDTPTLIFTGNYDYWPNLDAAQVLIKQIYPAVKRAVPEAELLIVGPNPPPELRALKMPGLRVTGHVPDLRPSFEDAMVYVSPLRVGAGIKNKILQAMAMQKPVVATPLSCDGIHVAHGQHVILAHRSEDIVKAVVRLLQNPAQRQELAANGRRLVEEQYTWRTVSDAYERLYDTVIREHGGRGL